MKNFTIITLITILVLAASYLLTYVFTYFICWSWMITFNSQYVWGAWALLFLLNSNRIKS